MSELRERMSNAMCLRGMAARTQEAYIGALVELAKYYPTFRTRTATIPHFGKRLSSEAGITPGSKALGRQ